MSDELRGKVILISGATGALGSAVTREFARTEARLALTGRSEHKLERLVAEVGLPAERIFTVPADVTQADGVRDMMEVIVARFERVDVLLNTVGGWRGDKSVGETEVEQWERMLTLNLRSAFLLSRAVLPGMLESGWGRIVHVSSRVAVVPRARQAGYSVAKMGVITLTEVIAAEVKGSGITANVILPSIIDTPANRKMMPKADSGKWVEPERFGATMRFLCSDDAASINGARIPIYGAV
ncbi:MAG: SDR family NAD(P)-dependent oxidoreductase [Chloroflexota bacterium]|nr:SDR family NAD(P)-dependent oxidoreductase [Chloroflexota bacterium]